MQATGDVNAETTPSSQEFDRLYWQYKRAVYERIATLRQQEQTRLPSGLLD